MSKDIKSLLAQKLAENNARHSNANPSTYLALGNELKRLPINKIHPNPYQPRQYFDEAEIANLSQSIDEIGMLQPITVRERDDGDYEIIAGERRFRAHQQLGKNHIDAIVTQSDDGEIALLALAENASRQDLCDYEIGQALRQIEHLFPNKSRLAESVGLNREDMYRYFSYEALPGAFLAKLATQPKLLSRTAATQIKQALNELQLNEEQKSQIMLDVWEKLVAGDIEQTKIANFLRSQTEPTIKITKAMTKPIIQEGKSIGKIGQKGKKYVVEINADNVSDNDRQAIERFVQDLMSKTKNQL